MCKEPFLHSPITEFRIWIEIDPNPTSSTLILKPDPSLVLDGFSDIGAHVRSKLCCLICIWQLIRSRAITDRIYFLFRNDIYSVMRAQHVLSY